MAGIIDVIQLPGTAGGKGLRIIPHLCEPDTGILGELFPQKGQPFFRYCFHVIPPIVMPCWGIVRFSSMCSCSAAFATTGSDRKLSSRL